jgi:hypothetical protein
MSSPLSILDILAEIPDPRHRRGIRHPLSAILGLAVLAMLSGCKSSHWLSGIPACPYDCGCKGLLRQPEQGDTP